MNKVLAQLKKRRLTLGLKQGDMQQKIGVSRQQYQFIESRGNPRLDTLELIVKGLGCRIVLVPEEKHQDVMEILSQRDSV